jgi:MoxR-like ATPase
MIVSSFSLSPSSDDTKRDISETKNNNNNVGEDDEALLTMIGLFRPLITSLIVRFGHPSDIITFERVAYALSRIIVICPHVSSSVIQWFTTQSGFSLFDAISRLDHTLPIPNHAAYRRLADVAHTLLHISYDVFSKIWNWSSSLWLLSSSDDHTRWLAASCLSSLLNMTEVTRLQFMTHTLHLPSLTTSATSSTSTKSSLHPELAHVEARMRLHMEQAAVWYHAQQQEIAQRAGSTSIVPTDGKSMVRLSSTPSSASPTTNTSVFEPCIPPPSATPLRSDSQLASVLVDVGGVLLPRKISVGVESKVVDEHRLVEVASTQRSLHAVALAISENKPCLLEGPIGCGKTSLVEHIATICGQLPTLVRIHLDDQMDSKTLMGSHTCTDVPGEIKWQPGALTQAVTQGRWAIIEDIDRAPFEVLQAIIPLLTQRRLLLQGRGDIIAHPSFQLFATRTTLGGGRQALRTEAAPLLQAHFSRVLMAPLNAVELSVILRAKHQVLSTMLEHTGPVLRTFMEFAAAGEAVSTTTPSDPTALPSLSSSAPPSGVVTSPSPPTGSVRLHGTRRISTRDLFNWCRRLDGILRHHSGHRGGSVDEEIMMSAADCFVAAVPINNPAQVIIRRNLIRTIATIWHVPPDRADYYCSHYKPKLISSMTELQVGRVSLARDVAASEPLLAARGTKFSHTKAARQLLERIAMSLLLREPILLVGETGIGKTSVIQHLADQVGKKLVVINLNQQSDSSDFLGGYKPVELQTVAQPLVNDGLRLFKATVSEKANRAFILQLETSFRRQEWQTLKKLLDHMWQVAEKRFMTSDPRSDKTQSSTTVTTTPSTPTSEQQRKAQKQGRNDNPVDKEEKLRQGWLQWQVSYLKFKRQIGAMKSSFAFTFAEGSLVKAIKDGDWILLDEINLASSETLERLAGVLEVTILTTSYHHIIITINEDDDNLLYVLRVPLIALL